MNYFKPEETVPIPSKDVVSWLFDNQQYDQNKPLWLDTTNVSRSISSIQARLVIRKLVAGFQAAGLMYGDCVCVHSFNDIYYSMVVLGIIGAGGIFTGTNPANTSYELAHHYRVSKVKYVITEPEMLDNVLVAARQCALPKENILIFNVMGQKTPLGYKSWTRLLKHGEQDWIRFDDENKSKTTPVARMFSSGTTGLPKAVIISHQNLIAQHTAVLETDPRVYDARRLLVLPGFHMSGFPITHIAPLRSGVISYVMRRFELGSYLMNVEKFGITEMSTVPTLVMAILMSPLSKKYSLKSVKDVVCGAAPLHKTQQGNFKALLAPGARITQVWGMTEATCIVTMFRGTEDDTTASVGRLVPNMEAKLIDDNDMAISAYDVEGEICVRGPCVTQGYFENEEANAASFILDGWFKTGDMAYCSGMTKKWYIVGRKKELIKVRGFQVAPLEIESVLQSHPGISDAAVIGVSLSRDEDELPRAYVVRRPGPGDNLTEEDIRLYSAQRLARYKSLDGGIRIVDSIPKNTLGKTLKRVLKEKAEAEFVAERSKI